MRYSSDKPPSLMMPQPSKYRRLRLGKVMPGGGPKLQHLPRGLPLRLRLDNRPNALRASTCRQMERLQAWRAYHDGVPCDPFDTRHEQRPPHLGLLKQEHDLQEWNL